MQLSAQLLLVLTGITSLSGAAPAPGTGLQQVIQAAEKSLDSITNTWSFVTNVDNQEKKIHYKDQKHHKDKKKHKDHKHKKHSNKPLTGERVRRKMKKAGIIPSGL